jgi:hypothetical protein
MQLSKFDFVKSLFEFAYDCAIDSDCTKLHNSALECPIGSCNALINDLRNTVMYEKKIYCSSIYMCYSCEQIVHITDVFVVLFSDIYIKKCICVKCSESTHKGSGHVKFDEKLKLVEQNIFRFEFISSNYEIKVAQASATLIAVEKHEKSSDYVFHCAVEGVGDLAEFNLGEQYLNSPRIEFLMTHSVESGVSTNCSYRLISFHSDDESIIGNRNVPGNVIRLMNIMVDCISKPLIILNRQHCCNSHRGIEPNFIPFNKLNIKCCYCGKIPNPEPELCESFKYAMMLFTGSDYATETDYMVQDFLILPCSD